MGPHSSALRFQVGDVAAPMTWYEANLGFWSGRIRSPMHRRPGNDRRRASATRSAHRSGCLGIVQGCLGIVQGCRGIVQGCRGIVQGCLGIVQGCLGIV
jgi:hypothetical protein